MIMKKISLIITLILLSFVALACSKEEATTDGKIDSIEEVTKKRGTLICTRSATSTNSEPFFQYTIDYNNDKILKLHSIEGITSTDSSILDTYYDSYEKISSYYKDLKYYDTNVTRKNNTVTWDTIINYEKIDINALLALEGEEDNIIKNGQASLTLWLELAKKVGTACTY